MNPPNLLDIHRKQHEQYPLEGTAFLVPVSIFHDRTVSVLEAISEYMKDSLGLTYHEVAVALERDDRTIWTCYNRAKAKRRKHIQTSRGIPS